MAWTGLTLRTARGARRFLQRQRRRWLWPSCGAAGQRSARAACSCAVHARPYPYVPNHLSRLHIRTQRLIAAGRAQNGAAPRRSGFDLAFPHFLQRARVAALTLLDSWRLLYPCVRPPLLRPVFCMCDLRLSLPRRRFESPLLTRKYLRVGTPAGEYAACTHARWLTRLQIMACESEDTTQRVPAVS